MGYFRELPDVAYQNFLSDSLSSQSYLEVKNLFRRNKVRDDLENVFTVFDKYEIREGARPDTIAEELYGDDTLDWVVLLTAGIINVRDEWPLENQELYNFCISKYGNDVNSIHHYETKELLDGDGRTILPSGQRVDSNFSVTYYYNNQYITPLAIDTLQGISNYEYELKNNINKSSIHILKRRYLQQFINDMRDIMIVQQSSSRVNDKLSQTENTRVTIPQ
mgnify:FL=1|tara:strand:- start:273 stop:935 length:663 start_codon:yes stop_codon:yes gene_type:complete